MFWDWNVRCESIAIALCGQSGKCAYYAHTIICYLLFNLDFDFEEHQRGASLLFFLLPFL
jgi:hypothetical protein